MCISTKICIIGFNFVNYIPLLVEIFQQNYSRLNTYNYNFTYKSQGLFRLYYYIGGFVEFNVYD